MVGSSKLNFQNGVVKSPNNKKISNNSSNKINNVNSTKFSDCLALLMRMIKMVDCSLVERSITYLTRPLETRCELQDS